MNYYLLFTSILLSINGYSQHIKTFETTSVKEDKRYTAFVEADDNIIYGVGLNKICAIDSKSMAKKEIELPTQYEDLWSYSHSSGLETEDENLIMYFYENVSKEQIKFIRLKFNPSLNIIEEVKDGETFNKNKDVGVDKSNFFNIDSDFIVYLQEDKKSGSLTINLFDHTLNRILIKTLNKGESSLMDHYAMNPYKDLLFKVVENGLLIFREFEVLMIENNGSISESESKIDLKETYTSIHNGVFNGFGLYVEENELYLLHTTVNEDLEYSSTSTKLNRDILKNLIGYENVEDYDHFFARINDILIDEKGDVWLVLVGLAGKTTGVVARNNLLVIQISEETIISETLIPYFYKHYTDQSVGTSSIYSTLNEGVISILIPDYSLSYETGKFSPYKGKIPAVTRLIYSEVKFDTSNLTNERYSLEVENNLDGIVLDLADCFYDFIRINKGSSKNFFVEIREVKAMKVRSLYNGLLD